MKTREIDRLAWGTDAGFYRILPKEVLMPGDEAGVRSILARARAEKKSITFRAAGTSLSGQAITDSLLVVCGKKWERFEVLDGGARIRLQPGIVGERVNEILRPYGRRFTPDPASVKTPTAIACSIPCGSSWPTVRFSTRAIPNRVPRSPHRIPIS